MNMFRRKESGVQEEFQKMVREMQAQRMHQIRLQIAQVPLQKKAENALMEIARCQERIERKDITAAERRRLIMQRKCAERRHAATQQGLNAYGKIEEIQAATAIVKANTDATKMIGESMQALDKAEEQRYVNGEQLHDLRFPATMRRIYGQDAGTGEENTAEFQEAEKEARKYEMGEEETSSLELLSTIDGIPITAPRAGASD